MSRTLPQLPAVVTCPTKDCNERMRSDKLDSHLRFKCVPLRKKRGEK